MPSSFLIQRSKVNYYVIQSSDEITRVMSDRQPIALIGPDGLEPGAGRVTCWFTTSLKFCTVFEEIRQFFPMKNNTRSQRRTLLASKINDYQKISLGVA